MIIYVTLGTLPPAPAPKPAHDFRVGDRVVRKRDQRTHGIITHIRGERATVEWQFANARRLGAVSQHKFGQIRLSSLRRATIAGQED